MFWHRLNRESDLIFGAQLNLSRVVDGLRELVQTDPELRDEICVALLDDNAKPIVISREKFQANWKHPFVATEIGETLPHWEVAAYLVNPAQPSRRPRTRRSITLGLLIAVLVLVIGIGSLLIVSSLSSELKLARRKTDFVSNVSHELKTPLTSIRMFSELLSEGRVTDDAKQRSYLNIITAEAARLTRLINNVLDFSRMERGEKKYNFQPCDLLTEVVRSRLPKPSVRIWKPAGSNSIANCLLRRRFPSKAMRMRCPRSSSICCRTPKNIPTAERKSPCSSRKSNRRCRTRKSKCWIAVRACRAAARKKSSRNFTAPMIP